MPEVALNEKEVTILKLMCEEKSTREIAAAVDLSPRTVEAIRDKLKTKTGAKSLAGLINLLQRSAGIPQYRETCISRRAQCQVVSILTWSIRHRRCHPHEQIPNPQVARRLAVAGDSSRAWTQLRRRSLRSNSSPNHTAHGGADALTTSRQCHADRVTGDRQRTC